MEKLKLTLVITGLSVILMSCGNKYSVENLKKDDKLLKETVIKCKEKKDDKICNNVERAQNELALEGWNKVKTEIKTRLDKGSESVKAGNYAASIDEMPEKLLKYLADKSSISVDELKKVTVETLNNKINGIKIIENSYDIENVKTGRTETGRNYAIIPTKVSMEINGQEVETEGNTMVFEDGNKWYIINFDKNFMLFAKEVYPDLAEIKIPD